MVLVLRSPIHSAHIDEFGKLVQLNYVAIPTPGLVEEVVELSLVQTVRVLVLVLSSDEENAV